MFVLLAWLIAARGFCSAATNGGSATNCPAHPAWSPTGSAGIGLAGSLMEGVSGGSMSTMVLTLYGKSIHAAVGTGRRAWR